MRALTVDVKSSTGRVLCCTVFRPGGKKLLAKGHVISDEDVRVLESEGMESIWVTELEDGEVGEDDAVCQVASEMGCGSFEIRLAAGGRANLDRKSTRLNSSHLGISYAVFWLKHSRSYREGAHLNSTHLHVSYAPFYFYIN